MLSFIKKLFKTSFLGACRNGNIDAVKQHLADGADINAKDEISGLTPLDYSENDKVTYLSEDDGRELENDLHEILGKLGAKTGEELKAEGKL